MRRLKSIKSTTYTSPSVGIGITERIMGNDINIGKSDKRINNTKIDLPIKTLNPIIPKKINTPIITPVDTTTPKVITEPVVNLNAPVLKSTSNALIEEFTSPALEFDDVITETTPEVVKEPKEQSETIKQIKNVAIGAVVSIGISKLIKMIF